MKTGKTILLGLIFALVVGGSAFSAEPEQNAPTPVKENFFVRVYRAIENGVVSGYMAIENGFVSGYQAVENAFVNNILIPLGWSPDSIPTGTRTTEDSVVTENPAESSMALSAEIREKYSPVQRTNP